MLKKGLAKKKRNSQEKRSFNRLLRKNAKLKSLYLRRSRDLLQTKSKQESPRSNVQRQRRSLQKQMPLRSKKKRRN